MESKKYEPSITYKTDGKGKWFKITGAKQCDSEDIFGRECQGVYGHKGCHWSYDPDGSYSYWKNDADPEAIQKNIACVTISPEDDSYISPTVKAKENYLKFYTQEQIIDETILNQLENEITPEENAAIDRPCSIEEIEELKRMGRI